MPRMRLEPGESHVGEVGTKSAVVDVTFVCETTALDTGDVATATAAFTGVRVPGGTCVVQSVALLDLDDVGGAAQLHFLRADKALAALDAAPSLADADLVQAYLGWVDVATTDYLDVGGAKVAMKTGVGLVLQALPGSQTLFVTVTVTGTPTYTVNGLRLRLGLLMD
jgi:hypothetical protein